MATATVGVVLKVLHYTKNKREQGNRKYLNLAKDEHLVRLHIGLEDPKDLIEDLKRSLKHNTCHEKVYKK